MAPASDFNDDIAATICERLADGESLRSICRDETMPSKSSVFKWLGLNKSFADQYARAMEARADSHADDLVDIADNPLLDANDKRVRIDARKWVAAKLRPKVYGEKQLLGSDPDNPLPSAPMIDLTKVSDEALKVLREVAENAMKGK